MAITHWYTGDGGSDSNGGTSHADRWLTVQAALDGMDQSQQNVLNIRGLATAEGGWDFTSHGSGTWIGNITQDNWMLFQGYDTVKGDRPGTAADPLVTIDGNATEIINADTLDSVNFRHLKFENWGSGTAFSLDDNCAFVECEFDGDGNRATLIDADNYMTIAGCKIHSMATAGQQISVTSNLCIYGNYIHSVSNSTNSTMFNGTTNAICIGNVFSMKSTLISYGIWVDGDGAVVINNTVFNQESGRGHGISVSGPGTEETIILNNIVAGFIGTGGDGISIDSGAGIKLYGHNKLWNNMNPETLTGTVLLNLGNNDTLGGNPFKSTGNADHNDDDFSVDASVKAGGWPATMFDPDGNFDSRNLQFLDAGALQRMELASGPFARSLIVQNIGTY